MKVFWALIGLLVLGTVGLFASGVLSSKPEAAAPIKQAPPVIAVVPPAPLPAPQVQSPPPPVAAPTVAAASPEQPARVTPTETTAATPAAVIPTAEDTSPTTPVTAAQAAEAPAPMKPAVHAAEPSQPAVEPGDAVNPLITLRNEVEAQRAAEAAKHEAQKPAAATPAAVPAALGADASAAEAPFAGAKVETKPDGSLLFDDKYIVKGKGTQEDPYKVTWDQLVSAQNEYAPKEGRKTIPPRIQALNDKWLDITGYVAFPLMTAEADELLSMMNQWDGCCIGVPPTPYDAVEVRLVNSVSGNARLTTYGSVKGKFKVDPHLVGGWLVGLYVMDQAKLTPVSYGGIAP